MRRALHVDFFYTFLFLLILDFSYNFLLIEKKTDETKKLWRHICRTEKGAGKKRFYGKKLFATEVFLCEKRKETSVTNTLRASSFHLFFVISFFFLQHLIIKIQYDFYLVEYSIMVIL